MSGNRDNNFLGVVGSTYVGVGLIVVIAAYVGAVSVLLQTGDGRVLGLSGTRPYGHPILLALTGLLVVNLLAASVHRVRLDLPRLGAWLSHAGVVLLLAGSAWYATAAQRGDAISRLVQPPPNHPGPAAAAWTPIEDFCLDDTLSVYVDTDSSRDQLSLGNLRDRSRVDLSARRDCAGGLSVRALRYIDKAVLSEHWTDDAPQPLHAVEVLVRDGQGSGRALICPAMERFGGLRGQGYILMYHPEATEELLKKSMDRPMPPHMKDSTLLMIMRGKGVAPQLLVMPYSGKRTSRQLSPGTCVTAELPEGKVEITLQRFLDHARLSYEAREATTSERGEAVPAAEVELSQGEWRHRTFLPMAQFPQAAPWQTVLLPGEKVAYLALSRRSVALGQKIQIVAAKYLANPGTMMPLDYRCEVELSGRRETIALNHPLSVGPYQFSQGSWSPSGENVQQITLGVASRPGVWLVYLGMILMSAGFPWAFYVKPLLLKRRARP